MHYFLKGGKVKDAKIIDSFPGFRMNQNSHLQYLGQTRFEKQKIYISVHLQLSGHYHLS